MSRVTAQFPAAPVTLTDGVPSGPPGQIDLLDFVARQIRRASVTPEGPTLPVAGWRGDPWAFVALAQEVEPGVPLEMSDDMPALPDGSEGGE